MSGKVSTYTFRDFACVPSYRTFFSLIMEKTGGMDIRSHGGVPKLVAKLFVESEWLVIAPPQVYLSLLV